VISTSDFRKGSRILFRGEPHRVIDFQHNKMGRGGALVRTRLKNLINGSIFEENFRSGEKFDDPQLERKNMQFLYEDGGIYNFMDQESCEQVSLNKESIEDIMSLLKEQEVYTMVFYNEKPIEVIPPLFMSLQIKETTPGIRGDTAQGACTKTATLETGLVIQVPLFVNEGDMIKLDTRDNSYIERL